MGQARRAALLERFGSVAALRKAALADLAMTPGIGEKIAEIIFTHLQVLIKSGWYLIDLCTFGIQLPWLFFLPEQKSPAFNPVFHFKTFNSHFMIINNEPFFL